jgi:hypothetical protein
MLMLLLKEGDVATPSTLREVAKQRATQLKNPAATICRVWQKQPKEGKGRRASVMRATVVREKKMEMMKEREGERDTERMDARGCWWAREVVGERWKVR